MTAYAKFVHGIKDLASYTARGIFNFTHNSFALLGIVVVFTFLGLMAHPDLRQTGEVKLVSWLHERQIEAFGMDIEAEATDRATAADPKDLPKQQAALAYWLSKKYRVAPEPLSALVAEAYEQAQSAGLEPTLILAIMAIESGFNPFAQSPVGAQGLMQVMTSVHTDKYEGFGGKFAAFDPVANLRVGVKVLKDCIARAGTLEGGLRQYVGASSGDDGGYAGKVLAENARLVQVSKGKNVPVNAPVAIPVTTPAPKAAENIDASVGHVKVALLSTGD
ncbi:MAG: lytic transglycosylase domain-containing protein [Hylemonella sp.]|nr:lytic transglycosylase domain-containing protein [Hylemonella sp.]